MPDKDEILDAFVAKYDDGNLYFGADRFANNGDAQIGFWFFHDEISLNPPFRPLPSGRSAGPTPRTTTTAPRAT